MAGGCRDGEEERGEHGRVQGGQREVQQEEEIACLREESQVCFFQPGSNNQCSPAVYVRTTAIIYNSNIQHLSESILLITCHHMSCTNRVPEYSAPVK